MKTEILYGLHPVLEALRADRRDFYEVFVAAGKTAERVRRATALAESKGIPVKTVSSARLSEIIRNGMHQGIAARVSLYPLVDLEAILELPAEKQGSHFILLLDNILDPHNFGALVRSADGVGIDGIIIPKDRSAPPSPAAVKASSGALEHARLVRVTNMASTIRELKKQGIWIVGLDLKATQPIFKSDLADSIALVIGGEEKGVRPLVLAHCDFLVSIPQVGRVESLNASVAGAVAMYEAYRQRTEIK